MDADAEETTRANDLKVALLVELGIQSFFLSGLEKDVVQRLV